MFVRQKAYFITNNDKKHNSSMDRIHDLSFGGERPLFGAHDVKLENITVTDGESAIKCCHDIECHDSKFYGKYPWWHVDRSLITSCYFAAGSRSAIWYSDDMTMRDCVIDGPKFFREMKHLSLENVTINDADETFWHVDDVKVNNVTLHGGTYPFMHCHGIVVDGLTSDAKYIFQYCGDVEIHNAHITTKDSFWECDNVTVYDSDIDGEYIGWHSKNLKFVRCHLSGEQILCYADNVTLEDCTIDEACDRMFEDCTNLNVSVKGKITNIKNPISGKIVADEIGSVTYDEFAKGHDTEIAIRK